MEDSQVQKSFRKSALPLKKPLLLLLAVVILALVSSGGAAAQNTTSFDGYTYDESGDPLNDTNVTVKYANPTPNTQNARTNESGYFNVTGIETGGILYWLEMEKWDGDTIEYIGKNKLTLLPSQYFEDLGTNGYYLSEAVEVNVTVAQETVLTGNHSVQTKTNQTATGYGDSLEWLNDTNQWAYIDNQNNLTILEADFTENTTVSMPAQNATALHYNGSNQFYALNYSKPSRAWVWEFNRSGELIGGESYNISDPDTGRYDEIGGLEYHNGSFYVNGRRAPGGTDEVVVDRYNNSFDRQATVFNESDQRVTNIHRYDGHWYTTELKEFTKLDDDWNKIYESDGIHDKPLLWKAAWNMSGLAHNGSGWYVGSTETGNISQVQLDEIAREGYAADYQVRESDSGIFVSEEWDGPYQNFSFVASVDRDYDIVAHKEVSTVRASHYLHDLKNESKGYDPTTNVRDIELNLTGEQRTVSGFVSENGSASFDNLSVVYWQMQGDRMDNKANENRTGDDRYTPANGSYEIVIETPADSTEEYMLFATAEKNGNHYGAFKNVTLSGSDISDFNMSLEPLQGQEGLLLPKPQGPPPDPDSDNREAQEVNITTAVQTFNLTNKTSGDPASLQGVFGFFGEVTMDYTPYWDDSREVIWTMTGGSNQAWDNSFKMPVIGKEGEAARILTAEFAPAKQTLPQDALTSNDPVDINLTQYDPGSIEESDRPLNISLYRGANSGQPHPEGHIKSANRTEFNSLEVALLGGHLGLRVEDSQNDIAVHYDNVDPTRSGPPDALFDTAPEQTGTDDSLEELWRFGSNGPETYDKVLISMPYNESIEDETITVEIPRLYDEEFNVIWNASTDDISDIRNDPDLKIYRDYLDTEYEAYLNGTGVVADESDSTLSTGIAYKDVDNDKIWLEIPHFSAVGLEVTGNIPESDSTSGGPVTYPSQAAPSQTATATPTPSPTATPSPTPMPTTVVEDEETATPTQTDRPTPSPTASPSPTTTETPGQPGFGILVAVAVLLSAALLAARRSERAD